MNFRERFLSKCVPEPINGCWVWTGYRNRQGYGRVLVNGRVKNAHRVAYLLLVGAIPEGLELDHKCRVRSCTNLEHLELVTHRENCLRGVGVGARNAKKTHCKRGHLLARENLYSGARRQCRLCRLERG